MRSFAKCVCPCVYGSDKEVANRWLIAFAPRAAIVSPEDAEEIIATNRGILLAMPEKLQHARETLGSSSSFMKHLKQPIAYLANKEDRCSGHFFESRFYSGALLDVAAVVAAMANIDLDPVRARIMQDIDDYEAASGFDRNRIAKNHSARIALAVALAVAPIVSELIRERPALGVSLETYLDIIEDNASDFAPRTAKNKRSRWFDRITSLKKRQRAFGAMGDLASWSNDRGWSIRGCN
jgi:hypothetical protein